MHFWLPVCVSHSLIKHFLFYGRHIHIFWAHILLAHRWKVRGRVIFKSKRLLCCENKTLTLVPFPLAKNNAVRLHSMSASVWNRILFWTQKVELHSPKWHCRTLIWPPCTRIAWSSAGTTDCPIATTYTISIIIIMSDSVPWRGSVSSAICRGKCSRTTTETVWHGDVPGRMPMPLIRRRQVVGDAGVPAPGRKWTNSWKVPLAMKLHA